jgi:hypothetical protein
MIRMKDLRDDDLWTVFEASASGDLATVKRLVETHPELVNTQYNYTPAIHFAVRGGGAIPDGPRGGDCRLPFVPVPGFIAHDRGGSRGPSDGQLAADDGGTPISSRAGGCGVP